MNLNAFIHKYSGDLFINEGQVNYEVIETLNPKLS